MKRLTLCGILAFAALAALATRSEATWSIVLADLETREVAVGTVTCLTSFDLLAIVPVVVVGEGAGAVQSAGDFAGIRRPVIFAGLAQGASLAEIFDELDDIAGHQQRQYGLAATYDTTPITFSGSQNGAWAGGLTGVVGTMTYAIQGNVLTGPCVIEAIEVALMNESEDVPQRLMSAMQAARAAGGDGRCSCSSGNPPGCGCPPSHMFLKSGHIGGMVVARIGDIDDSVCNASGCVDGDYFMRLNVAFQSTGAPDPVAQLQTQFDAWRAAQSGRPDALVTTAEFEPPIIPPNGVATTTLRITPRDGQGDPVVIAAASAQVVHGQGSAGLSTILSVTDGPGETILVELLAGSATGVDRFAVTLDDGVRPVVLMPEPRLEYFAPGDVDGSGAVGFNDLLQVLGGWGPCAAGEPCPLDLDGDGEVGFTDLLIVLAGWTV